MSILGDEQCQVEILMEMI